MTPHPSTTSTTLPVGILTAFNDHNLYRCRCGFVGGIDDFDCFAAADEKWFCNRCYVEFDPNKNIHMMLPARLDALHAWLLACTSRGPEPVTQMVDDLKTARANGIAWDGVPGDGITMQELLVNLEADGRAVRNEPGGTLWRWAPGRAKEAVEKQASLF
jgi:hypothetical protein